MSEHGHAEQIEAVIHASHESEHVGSGVIRERAGIHCAGVRPGCHRSVAGPLVIVPAPRLAPTEAARRWATLLQQRVEVDALGCPACHGAMPRSVIDQILTHLRTRATTAAPAGALLNLLSRELRTVIYNGNTPLHSLRLTHPGD